MYDYRWTRRRFPGPTTIYTLPGCPWCEKIKKLYKQNEWPYHEKIINVNLSRSAFYNKFYPGATFPQVVIRKNNKNETIGGYADTIQYLRQN